MVICGIDPGYATIGFGIVRKSGNSYIPVRYGAVTTSSGLPMSKRLNVIYSDFTELFNIYEPDVIAVEELFFNTNTKTALGVAQARGVILLCGENYGVPVYEYTPLQVKQAVVGYGRATKTQMMEMTKRLLALEKTPKPDDAADALAVAICHGNTGRMAEAAIYTR